MDTTKLTIEQLGEKVKAKYPQYADIDSKELGLRTLDKYPEYQQRIQPEQSGFVAGIKEDLAKRGENINEAFNKDQSFASKTLQLLGQGAGFVGDIVGEGVKAVGRGISAITPDVIEKPVVNTAKAVGVGILNTPLGQAGLKAIEGGMESYNQFKQANPETAGNLEAVVNIASLFPIGKGSQMAAKGAIRGGEVVGGVVKPVVATVGKGVDKALDIAKSAPETVRNVATGVKNVAGITRDYVANIPSRVATNVADVTAVRNEIKKLPSQVARQSVQDGVAIDDAKFLLKLPTQSKKELVKLVDVVKKFDAGDTRINPQEIVGKPMVKALGELKTKASNIGKELGDVADNLGVVTKPELETGVFARLQKVNGLEGLQIKNGKLDFSNTNLASSLSKSDRQAIQEAYKNATKWGNGKKAHLFRQELFEVLGGKKKSGIVMTDTQDRAFQAIRTGLSDVLEAKNPTYKTLSNEYRKTIEPINALNKALKANGVDEDILEMSAGLLARKLTSNAASNPQIKQLLRNIDKALGGKSNKKLSIETLQNLYNVLERYYPSITGGTTLKAQVTGAIEGSPTVSGLVGETIKSTIGQSDAVRKNAIEKLLKEVFGK